MNPVARMMKRYIKMPLKYALPLLFIGALVLAATTGCTSTSTKENVTQLIGNVSTASSRLSVSLTRLPDDYLAGKFSTAPSEGNKFVFFNATVTNKNAKDTTISAYNFKLRDSQGNVYDRQWLYFTGGVKQFDSMSNSQPGDKYSGVIVFDVPTTAKLKTLTYDDTETQITTNL
jgi:hypothetical protein